MLEPTDLQKLQALSGEEAKQYAGDLIERLSRQIKFEQTKNQALTFELARLKQWRFGQSSESLDASGQLVVTADGVPCARVSGVFKIGPAGPA